MKKKWKKWLDIKWLHSRIDVMLYYMAAVITVVGTIVLTYHQLKPQDTVKTDESVTITLDEKLFENKDIKLALAHIKKTFGLRSIFTAFFPYQLGEFTQMKMGNEFADVGFEMYDDAKEVFVEVDDEGKAELKKVLEAPDQCLVRFVRDFEEEGFKKYLEDLGVKTHLNCVVLHKDGYMVVVVGYWDEEIDFTGPLKWTLVTTELKKLRDIHKKAIE